jgi:hypothetical protein
MRMLIRPLVHFHRCPVWTYVLAPSVTYFVYTLGTVFKEPDVQINVPDIPNFKTKVDFPLVTSFQRIDRSLSAYVVFRNVFRKYWGELCRPSNFRTGESAIFGCPRWLIQCIRSHSPHHEVFSVHILMAHYDLEKRRRTTFNITLRYD